MEIQHDYNQAIETFEKALKNSTRYGYPYSSTDIWNVLGVSYYELKNYHKAVENFENALEIDNQYELAYYNKTITLQKLNKRKKVYNSSGKVVYQETQ